jgi:O-antigen/teichoic acid export membrane protein
MNARILKGSSTLAVAEFSRRALLAATVLLCARFLTPTVFGDYVFLLSLYQIFAVLGGAGTPSILLRLVATDRRSGVGFGIASIIARLAYIFPAALVMCFVVKALGFLDQYLPNLILLILLMIARGATENISFIFQGREDQISAAKIGVLQSATTLLTTLSICLSSKSLLMLIGAHVLGALVSTAYGILKLSAGSPSASNLQSIFDESWRLLKQSHWLNAGSFAASAYNRADVLLLRRMVSSEAVAAYGVPYRILDVTQIIPSSIVAAVLPGLCRRSGEAPEARPDVTIRLLLCAAFVLVIAVTVAAPPVTLVLFGMKYEASIAVLRFLIFATIPMSWNFVLNAQFIAHSFDRAILYAAGVALAVNVTLNVVLIPHFGYLACAAVTVVTELTLLAVNLRFASIINAKGWPEDIARVALGATLVTLFCIVWPHDSVSGWIKLLILASAIGSLPMRREDVAAIRIQGLPMGRFWRRSSVP